MSLPNRFLRPPLRTVAPNRQWIAGTTLLWLGFSYTLFLFAHSIREGMRFYSADMGEREILVFTNEEHSFYLFFLALFALSVSFGLIFRSYILTPSFRDRRFRKQKSAIYTDLGNLNVISLWVVAKVAFVFAAFGMAFPIFRGFDFYGKRFWLVVLPLIVFVQQWSTFNRLFLWKGVKWMGFFMGIMIASAFVFSRVPLIDPKRVDQMLLRSSPAYYIRYDLPTGGSEAKVSALVGRRAFLYGLNIGYDRASGSSEPKIFSNEPPFDTLNAGQIAEHIHRLRMSLAEFAQDRVAVHLAADKDVRMKKIKATTAMLSTIGIRGLYFSIDDPFKRFSPDKVNAYHHVLRPPCESAAFGMEKEWCDAILEHSPAVDVVHHAGEIFFNGEKVSLSRLYLECRDFIESTNGKGVLRFYSHDEAKLSEYLELYNEILRVYHDLRDEIVSKKFKTTYREAATDPWGSPSADEAIQYAKEIYPLNVVHLTDSEKDRLLQKYPPLIKHFP